MKGIQHERIAVLDGWRGIAILLVIGDHVSKLVFHSAGPTGQHGVTAFFVLSGFLITGKLLEPNASLGRFYVRRAFRLMPVAWIFVYVMWIGGFIRGDGHHLPTEIWACILFARNYFMTSGIGSTVPYWSLSIEEQFYFVWPLLLLAIGVRRAKWIALCGALGSYTLYLTHRSFYDHNFMNFHSEVRADALLIGCFAALAFRDETIKERFIHWARIAFWPSIVYLAWESIQLVAVPSLLECSAWCLVITYGAFTGLRWVSSAPLVWLGRISYSLYVWNAFAIGVWTSVPPILRWVAIFIPITSYYLIEKPGIAAGTKVCDLVQKTKLNRPMRNFLRPWLVPLRRSPDD